MERANILISGNMGSGKTTLLNKLLNIIAPEDRVVLIERQTELSLELTNDLRLGLPVDTDTESQVSLSSLVEFARSMQPDRIIVGEIEGSEAFALINAMNGECRGCMATLYANSIEQACTKLEQWCLQLFENQPELVIREQIGHTWNLIVHQERLPDGSRRLTRIARVAGVENNRIKLVDLFVFEQFGVESGRIIGQQRWHGAVS